MKKKNSQPNSPLDQSKKKTKLKSNSQKAGVANPMPWGGRFEESMNELAFDFSASFDIDKVLFEEDIEGSLAHVEMLMLQGIIDKIEFQKITTGLKEILVELNSGNFKTMGKEEDIHMSIESRLREKIGPVAGKLHTARSRNDQVALDERLFLKKTAKRMIEVLLDLQLTLLAKATEHEHDLMPGYTHLQRAQPILLSHHLLAYVSMFERDKARFTDAAERMNQLPLGSAALAGTSFPIDRLWVAQKLGFREPTLNSLDSVSDRDFMIEFVSNCSMVMMHLSRLSEELILWTSFEFGFATIGDAFTTGSSIMPQKKNPDMAELIRGKTGRVYGDLMNLLTLMKGLPLAYNRDMQEDKPALFSAIKTTRQSLQIMSAMLKSTEFHKERIESSIENDFSTATEIADYLAKKGVPFREAHEVTGKIVGFAIKNQVSLKDIEFNTLKGFSSKIEKDLYQFLDPKKSVAMRKSFGAASPDSVKYQLKFWKKKLVQV
ncbi:MAG: argininosuccinate lyase [Chloroherpetonaceae bacterium]|nr:argininosuccinate lyase [Chloroherpetonaceae bacterium]